MSQQLQITGGAKVRSLEGVITGSTGVLGSLPINGSNGIPQLDVNGKILVSQLPNSVMEYLGTWDAATNTPTLANGTGNAGDVYLCNVAGTVNFGAGPITFYVGDQVIYSGSIWQRASGATGSVTSVAVTETGDALTITGSPITTSGTINIGFAGTSAQYVAGDGTLVTFPTITTEAQRLITEVYNETGATLTKGTVVYINGGHGNLPTIAKALATSDATSAQTYGVVQSDIGNNNNGYVVVIGSLTDLDTQAYANGTQLYLSPTTAGAWTSTKQYAPAHLVYVGIVTRSHPTQGVVEIKIQNGYELDELHNVSAQTPSNSDGLFYNSSNSLWENKSISTALGYTPVSGSGTTNYIPKFTGSTSVGNSSLQELSAGWLQLGSSSINTSELDIVGNTGAKVYLYDGFGSATIQSYYNDAFTILTQVSGQTTNVIDYNYATKTLAFQTNGNNTRLNITSSGNIGIGNTNDTYKLDVTGTGRFSGQLTLGSTITNGTYTYTLPSATGTLALTSDIPSVTNFVTLNTLQTIIGTKIYTSLQYYNNGVYLQEGTSGSSTGYTSLAGNTNGIKINLGTGTSNNNLNFASTTTGNTYTFPNATGTIALTTDLSSYVPTSRTLTINGTTYDLSADRSWTVSGSQWTTSGSDIYYNTGNVGINQSSPTYKLDVGGTGRFTSDVYTGGDLTSTRATGFTIKTTTTGAWTALYGDTGGLYLGTNAGNWMFINNSGNVAIGNTTPSYKLDVSGTIRATGTILAGATNGNIRLSGTTDGFIGVSTSTMYLTDWATAAIGMTINLSSGNVGIGTNDPQSILSNFSSSARGLAISNAYPFIGFNDTDGGKFFVGTQANLAYLWNGGTDAMIFATNNAERMRITSGGEICFNSSSSIGSGLLSVAFAGNVYNAFVMRNTNSGNTGNFFVFQNSGGGNAGYIQQTSSTTILYSSSSDYRLKEDLKDYNGLELISKIKTYDYQWKEDKLRMYGVMAHELQEVIPYAVGGKKDAINKDGSINPQGVDYSKIVPILVKAIQELKAEIEELKNK